MYLHAFFFIENCTRIRTKIKYLLLNLKPHNINYNEKKNVVEAE